MALFLQLIGLLLLGIGMWFGYRQWILPHQATLTPAGRGLLILMVATLMGGFIGAPFWWMDQPLSFSWDLPPLASRMLASAGWAFFAVALLALRRPTFRRLRLVLVLLFVYLAPLTLIILVFHLDQFDFTAPITYGFFAIAVPMTLASAWYLVRQPHIIPPHALDTYTANPVFQGWLAVVAVITGLWGIALLVTDSGPSPLIWAWSGELLSSRLIGVMLITIAAGAIFSIRFAETARLMLAMIWVYTLGITIAALWNLLLGLPLKLLYVSVFGVLWLVTSVLLISDRQPSQVLHRRTNHLAT